MNKDKSQSKGKISQKRQVVKERKNTLPKQGSEEQLIIALEAANLGTWAFDLETGIAVHSLRHDQIFGYQELLPEWSYEISIEHMLPEFHKIARDAVSNAIKTGNLYFEAKVLWPDGSIHWIAPTGRVQYDDAGKPCRISGVVADITERKKSEESLRASERRYSALFSNKINGMAHCRVIYDESDKPINYRIIEINEAYERIIGIKKADIEGRLATEAFPDIKNYKIDYISLYGNLAFNRGEIKFEEFFEASQQYLSIYAYSPEPGEFVAIFTDVIDRITGEKKLSESEEKYRSIVETANEGIMTSADGLITFANKKMADMLGYKVDELIGKRGIDFISPDEIALSKARIKSRRKGEIDSYNIKFKHKNGAILYMHAKGSPIYDSEGLQIGNLGMYSDITKFKLAEETLRINEKRFHSILNNSLDFIYRFNLQTGQYEHANPSIINILGYSVDEFTSMDLKETMDKIYPDDLPFVSKSLKELEKTGSVVLEYRMLQKQGSYRWIENHLSVIKDNNGLPLYRDGIVHDISDRKKAEESIAASEQEFRLLTESMPQIVWTTTADGQNTYFNHKWIEYTGLTLQESYGHGWNKPFHPDDQKRAWDAWQNAVQHNAAYLLQCRLRRFDGVYRWWLIHGVPVVDKKGTITKWYGTCTDIDEMKNANDTIRHNEELLRSVIENVSSGVALIDETGRFVIYNPVFLKLFGLSPDSTIKNVNDQDWSKWQVFDENKNLLHVDNHPVRKAAMTGKLVKNQLVAMKLPSGVDYIWMMISAEPLKKEDGTIDKIICTYHDITERNKAEEALKESEERFHTMADALPQLAWIAHRDGYIYWYNQRWYEYTGTTEKQMEGWGWQSVHDPKVLSSVLERWKNSIDKGNPFDMEFPIRGADGIFRPFLTRGMPLKDSKGQVVQWIGTNTDITERKKAEETLKDSQEKLELALSTGNVGIWEWNLITNEVSGDQRTNEIMHSGKKEIKRTRDEFMQLINEEDIFQINKAMKETLEKDIPFDTIFRLKEFIEEPVYISSKAKAIKDENGNAVRLLGVCIDISEIKSNADKVLNKLNNELLRSNKELQSFAYVASHDLQEPLRMVSSFTQLLAQRYKHQLDQNAQEYIQFAVDGAQRMQQLLMGLLEYSRINSKGKAFENIDLNKVLEKALNNLSLLINERNAVIKIDSLPNIIADEIQIMQVFQNFIANAIKFSNDSPKIFISSKTESKEYVFSIKDKGIGIETDYFEKIFQIFQKLHTKEQYEGTGIGLAICKRIIERHGGTIWVESKLGKGSTFFFTIPKDHL
jgi:PAS domain S-box-containing protein